MRRLFHTGLLCLILAGLKVQAQKALKIGDSFPYPNFDTVITRGYSDFKIDNLKDKLLIIDFWAPSCLPCLAAMPRIDSLQKEFGSNVAIITALTLSDHFDQNEKNYAMQFWDKNKITAKISLPFVIDESLMKLFPHPFASHQIWIDKNGIVIAKTSEEYVSRKNVQFVLAGNEVNFPVDGKIDQFNYKAPLLISADNGAGIPSKVYHSAFIDHLPQVTPVNNGWVIDSSEGTKRWYIINKTIPEIYRSLFKLLTKNSDLKYQYKRLIFEGIDSSRLYPNKEYQSWAIENTFCYEITVPLSIRDSLLAQYVINDMERFLNLHAQFEFKPTDCFVLKSHPNKNKLKQNTSPFNAQMDLFRNNLSGFSASYSSISEFTRALNNSLIVFDETNIQGSMNLTIEFSNAKGKLIESLSDWQAINKQLIHYGLELVPQVKTIEMLVVKD